MHIFKKIENDIKLIVEDLQAQKKLPEAPTDKIEAMPPKDASHGDISTNAAMVLAAATKKNPREIATLLLEPVKKLPHVVSAEIAGPGFINITFAPALWQGMIADILKEGVNYGASKVGAGEKINIEYVSANPTGPMHVGHGRGAVYGDALADLLVKAGYDVTREYYINDAGGQIDKLVNSVNLRYREICEKKDHGDVPEGYYPGEYLIPVAQAFYDKHGDKYLHQNFTEWYDELRELTLAMMMDMIKSDLAVLGIRHAVFSSERAITKAGKVEEAIAALDKKGLIYTGVLEAPKGKAPDDWEPRPQTLFKSTQFGDDIDRAVKKSDGSWTYFAPDIAYHFDKCQRGFTKLIDVFGADHGGYVKRIKAAVSALSDGKVETEVKLCQLVKFMRGGEPLKMSKRAGTFVTVREVVDEVGKDVFRFIMLTRKNDVPLDFDFEKVMEQSKDNPVFYVQYAHARAHSIIRKAAEEAPEASAMAAAKKAPLSKLSHPEELALIRRMASFPRAVESAAAALEPHRIAFWLHDLAAAFHGLWNLGNDDLGLRFIVKSDIELTAARITLAEALSQVIASGLTVLGVKPLEEMR